MTERERQAAIAKLVASGMDRATAAAQVDAESGVKKYEAGGTWDLGNLGKAGLATKGLSIVGDIGSLATAGDRQETMVGDLNKLADKVGTSVDVDDSGVNRRVKLRSF